MSRNIFKGVSPATSQKQADSAPSSEVKPARKTQVADTSLRLVEVTGDTLAQQTDGTPKTMLHTDVWCSELFLREYSESVRYCSKWKKWLSWSGSRWVECDDDGEAMSFAIETTQRFAGRASTETEIKHATKMQSASKIASFLRLASKSRGVAVKPEKLDADPLLFNVSNGTIDLRTGTHRAHSREDFITKISPVAFDPGAECPMWLRFLDRIFASKTELIAFVQRMFGYCLSGSVKHQVLFFLHGDGNNGKSILLSIQSAVMGEYALKAPPSLLFESKGHPTEIASLYGARVAQCAEVPKGHAFDEAKIKDLTGGEAITARRISENFWSFTPTHKLVLAGNHKPVIRGGDHGIWRRIMLVPFSVIIPPHEVDPNLAEKLQTELPGILNWALAGWLALQANGLQPPEEVRAAVQDYRDESDPLADFFACHLVFEPSVKVARIQVTTAYQEFCADIGAKRVDSRELIAALKKRGVTGGETASGKTSVWVNGQSKTAWIGVRLKTEREREGVDSAKAEPTQRDASSMNEPGDW